MRIARGLVIFLALAIGLVLVGCGGEIETALETTPVPSRTATATPVPPTATATLTPSETPTPTQTLIPFEAIENPLVIVHEFTYIKPGTTPIPVPEEYYSKLVKHSTEDYIQLILDVEDYAFDTEWLSSSVYPFIHSHEEISLFAEEAGYFHSESPEAYLFRWKQAMADATYGSSASDDWIISEIQRLLNNGLLSYENLDKYLNQYGFRIHFEKEIPGVVPWDNEAKVIIINTSHLGELQLNAGDGLVVILSIDEEGDYQLTKLVSDWNLSIGNWWYFDIGEEEEKEVYKHYCRFQTYDINQNGVLELCLQYTLLVSGGFPTDLYLFEWDGQGFVNYFEELPTFYLYTDYYMYPEERPDMVFSIDRKSYGWYTKYYDWKEGGFNLAEANYYFLIDDITNHWDLGRYREAVLVLEDVLYQGPPYKPFDGASKPGEERKELLTQFLLGFAYVYNSGIDQARGVLEYLSKSIDEPIVSELAFYFYRDLYDILDLYGVCVDVQAIISDKLVSEFYWGEEKAFIKSLDTLFEETCSGLDYIEKAIELIPQSETVSLLEELRNSGFEINDYEVYDFFEDGKRDWILNVESPWSDNDESIYLVLNDGNKWDAFRVGVDNLYSADEIVSQRVSLEGLPGEEVILASGSFVTAVSVEKTDQGWSVMKLWEDYGPQKFFLFEEGDIQGLVTNYYYFEEGYHDEPDYIEDYWYRYVWDPEQLTFVEDPISVFEDPNHIIQLSKLIPNLNPSYELGLAYELLGNEAKAVETYWRVWNEDPGSVWAILARTKLVGVE